ncbi:PilZ domain-containing protein [Sphingomonas sp. GB1N7]|uniref:PilZ domain-containing protein n=1 Tax=Parasphingomonas caseinilytica TaxID=3096158 RepID=UPI002FC5F092
MFAAEFESAEVTGHRSATRTAVSLNARVGRGGFYRTLCKVTDLTIHGARLQTYSAMRKGDTIWLTLPLVGQVAATVMWADDFEAGCRFGHPLDMHAFEELTALASPST